MTFLLTKVNVSAVVAGMSTMGGGGGSQTEMGRRVGFLVPVWGFKAGCREIK